MSSDGRLSIGEAVRLACIMEVGAPKAGNVHCDAAFADTTWRDFVASAEAIAPVLAGAAGRSVGETILEAVRATRRVTTRNTNLGIILLLAPLCAVPVKRTLRSGIRDVLASLTVADAELAYEAIRLANPGGLGATKSDDVRQPARVTLLEAMRLAAERDAVARQYATQFATVLDPIASDLTTGDLLLPSRIVAAHLKQIAREPDSLIVRKCGPAVAEEATAQANDVLRKGWPHSAEGLAAFMAFDRWLRADGNRRNPGTSADLIAAGLFAVLRDGALTPPRDWPMESLR